jgi:hypothetical protein
VCQFLPPNLPNSQASVSFPQREARLQPKSSFGAKQPGDHNIEHADGHATAIVSFSDVSSNRRIAPDSRPPKRRKTISAALEMKRQLGLQLTSSIGRVKDQEEGNWGEAVFVHCASASVCVNCKRKACMQYRMSVEV